MKGSGGAARPAVHRSGLAASAAALVLLAGCTVGAEDSPQPSATAVSPPASDPTATASVSPSVTAEPFGALDDYLAQQLEWSSCGGGFECATLMAPLDYADLGAGSIEVALNRLPSSGAAERVGSLLVNPGGPGSSGLDYARAEGVVSEGILAAYDLVGFDPRGVGQSTPVQCVDDAELDAFIQLDPTPDDDAELSALDDAAREFADMCELTSGELLPHVGTADVARDLDLMRAVLGDSQLNYYGASYGTFIGSNYAELFPANVGRLVLDGALDPSLTEFELGVAQAEGFDTALRSFAADCLTEVTWVCPLTGSVDDAVGQVGDLFAQAEEAPLQTSGDRELGENLASFGVAVTLYDREYGWPLLREGLTQALQLGDGSILLQLSDLYFEREPDGSYATNGNEANVAVNCLDRAAATDLAAVQEQADRYAERAPIFGPFIAYQALPCAHWPVPPQLDPHPIAAAGAAPILVVGTTRDPATPYAAAVSLADQLESGVLLTYDGDGHTAYGKGNACVDEAVDTYLLTGQPPADGTTC